MNDHWSGERMQSWFASKIVRKASLFAFDRITGVTTFSFLLALLFTTPAHSQATLAGYEDTTSPQQNLFYRGTDQHIYLKYSKAQSSGWATSDLTSLSGAPLAGSGSAVSSFKDPATNEQHVIFEGTNQHIYDLFAPVTNLQSWRLSDLNALTGSAVAASGSSIASLYDNVNHLRFVFYVGTDQHINLAYWYGSWYSKDLTITSGGPVAAVGTALSAAKDDARGFEHLYYEGVDQHIHELYTVTDPNNIFAKDDTASANALPAAVNAPITSYYDQTNAIEHVFYLGSDYHLRHLFFTTYWQAEDITPLLLLPTAAFGSSLSSFQDTVGKQQHVFFLGSDQHLYQIYGTASPTGNGTWNYQDVTLADLAPVPALNSPFSSFKDDPDNQQNVFFLGTNQHLYHMYWSGRWSYEDLSSTVLPAF
jgi:hypothetical protein